MKMITQLLTLLVCAVLVSGCATSTSTAPQHQAEQSVVGVWKCDDSRIKDGQSIFRPDESFVITATMADDSTQRHEGTYKVLPAVLELTLQEGRIVEVPYTLQGDVLRLKDPRSEAWITFTRK